MPNRIGLSTVTRETVSRLAAAAGAGIVALSAAAGPASADDLDLNAAVNTTCTYPQVMAAMNAQAPDAAAKFNATPMAQSWLQRFLDASPSKRQKMAQKAEKMDSGSQQQYIGLVTQILNTCGNY